MVLTLDFGLSLANKDPLQVLSRIIPAANIPNFFTLLSSTKSKATVLKDCMRGEAQAQSSEKCTGAGEIFISRGVICS
jgi:hypothetical protein